MLMPHGKAKSGKDRVRLHRNKKWEESMNFCTPTWYIRIPQALRLLQHLVPFCPNLIFGNVGRLIGTFKYLQGYYWHFYVMFTLPTPISFSKKTNGSLTKTNSHLMDRLVYSFKKGLLADYITPSNQKDDKILLP